MSRNEGEKLPTGDVENMLQSLEDGITANFEDYHAMGSSDRTYFTFEDHEGEKTEASLSDIEATEREGHNLRIFLKGGVLVVGIVAAAAAVRYAKFRPKN